MSELSRNRPRFVVGPDSEPKGHLCDKCEQREAFTAWGDAMAINHGQGEWRCEICALTEQLEHAQARGAAIPDIERRLRELNGPSPSFWPGQADHEETGPIGDGTAHARMHWFWERMREHETLVEELTDWSPVSSSYRWEAAIADAFDKLAKERI